MATAARILQRPFWARIGNGVVSGGKATAPIFLGALLAALFTYLVTAKLNKDAALQQQYLAAVQEFSATGARVDASITTLSDATYDKASIQEAKKDAREAVAAHAAASLGIMPVVGKSNVIAYMQGLADMRVLVDQANDVNGARRAARGRMALIENRLAMVAESRRVIYD